MKSTLKSLFSRMLLIIAGVLLVSSAISSCKTTHKTKYGGPTAEYKKLPFSETEIQVKTTNSHKSSI
jgi:hypothetical protein